MKLTKAQLTADQSARKAELETIISEHIASFKVCGEALAEVRNDKLYLDEFDTFEEYVSEKWGMSQSRAYQLMDGSRTAKRVQQIVELKSEGAARALTKLKPAAQLKVAKRLSKVAKKTKLTGKIIEAEVVKELPRGGLAAQAMRARKEESSTPIYHAIRIETAIEIERIIQDWYARERHRLNEYPPATPERVVTLIVRLLKGELS